MPREQRKRGKKHRKEVEEPPIRHVEPVYDQDEKTPEAGPSWITKPNEQTQNDVDAPFGELDQDLKTYFRTVDAQMKQWIEEHLEPAEGDEEKDPNEDRRVFFLAALQEMNGKEKQLAADAECSTILERMLYSMDDFVRRVFFDALSGSHVVLAKHRFASHVVQTFLSVARDTTARESKGVFPPAPASSNSGELRTMTQLLAEYFEEIRPSLNELMLDPFGSHVIRALLLLIAPSISPSVPGSANNNMRSRKSAKWKARQGPMKTVFHDGPSAAPAVAVSTPQEFDDIARNLVFAVREELGENEVRALAADKVASPVLQLLLELESHLNLADQPGSLMDRVLVGMITMFHEDPEKTPPVADYLGTLLRDPTSSHLLETLITRSPPPVLSTLFELYFKGKLARLANHPVANFVVAKVIVRANEEVFTSVVEELRSEFGKIVAASRVGVVRAIVDQAATLSVKEADIVQSIQSAFGLDEDLDENKPLLVPCVLQLKTKGEATWDVKPSKAGARLSFSTPGSLLLQSMLRLRDPFNQCVTSSILAMDVDSVVALCHDATSSRVIDAFIDSTSVSKSVKRKLSLSLIGHYHELVDDRIGSRVGDRLWDAAEPYLKEKIARSLLPHEQTIGGSEYGKYFARRLKLHVLRKRPDEWKDMQSTVAAAPIEAPVVPAPALVLEMSDRKPKRKVDEIDVLFDSAGLGAKKRRSTLKTAHAPDKSVVAEKVPGAFADLSDILGAIKAAPKSEKQVKKKKQPKTN